MKERREGGRKRGCCFWPTFIAEERGVGVCIARDAHGPPLSYHLVCLVEEMTSLGWLWLPLFWSSELAFFFGLRLAWGHRASHRARERSAALK
jgi:hypothetical protein